MYESEEFNENLKETKHVVVVKTDAQELGDAVRAILADKAKNDPIEKARQSFQLAFNERKVGNY